MLRSVKAPAHSAAGILNAGWLRVERSMHGSIDTYETENQCEFAGGWLEVRKYRWSRPIENIWSTERRCYLITLPLAGHESASVITNLRTGESEPLEPGGQIHLVPPQQTMRCQSRKGQVRSMRCALDAGMVESLLNGASMWDWQSVPLQEEIRLGGGQIEWLLRRMYREISEPDFATGSMVEALARQLAAEILRRFQPPGAEPGSFVGGLSARHKRLIRERLQASRPLPDREELAGLCDMSVRHLSRAFRADTGQTLGRYIDSIMVERAKALLVTGATVRDVAASIGYASACSFASAFRRATGVLPSEIATVNKGRPGGLRYREQATG
jgi:AraC family transcriptional regulator